MHSDHPHSKREQYRKRQTWTSPSIKAIATTKQPRKYIAHTSKQTRTDTHPNATTKRSRGCTAKTLRRVCWTTWWLWRGPCTRSHPELGREKPQRPWYCVSRHGRVGRRQVFQHTQGAAAWLAPLYDQNIITTAQPLRCRSLQQTKTNAQSPNAQSPNAGWSSPVARQAHNLKVISSNLVPATTFTERANKPRSSTVDAKQALVIHFAALAVSQVVV